MINEINFEDIPEALLECGEQVARYTAEYEFLNDLKKVVLARLSGQYDGSENKREREALSHPEYKEHLHDIETARYEMLKHKSKYESLQTRFDWCRSNNSLKIAEMRLT